jgi:hypothetical protein
MRKSLTWALSVAYMATFLPTAQAWHKYGVAPVPVMGVPGQNFAVQSFGVQSYALTSAPVQSYALTSVPVQSYGLTSVPVQSYSVGITSVPVQSFGVQSYSLAPMGQSLTAQGLGTDLGSLLLNRLLGGGTTPSTSPDTSSLVTELRNNTAALKTLTDAVKANTAAGSDNTSASGSSGPGLLTKIPGVNAQALQAGQAAYLQALVDQHAEALASKKPAPAPSTSADFLTGAQTQINTATTAAIAAQTYLKFADTQNSKDANEIKRLTDLLKKIGQ